MLLYDDTDRCEKKALSYSKYLLINVEGKMELENEKWVKRVKRYKLPVIESVMVMKERDVGGEGERGGERERERERQRDSIWQPSQNA